MANNVPPIGAVAWLRKAMFDGAPAVVVQFQRFHYVRYEDESDFLRFGAVEELTVKEQAYLDDVVKAAAVRDPDVWLSAVGVVDRDDLTAAWIGVRWS